MASGVADAIFIKQLLEEIQEHIGIKTFSIPDKHPVTDTPIPAITVLTDSTSATSLVQKMGLNRRSKHIELKFLWLQDHHKNGVIKVKRVSSREILLTSLPKCISIDVGQTSFFLWPSRTSCRRGEQLPSLQQLHLLCRHQVQEGFSSSNTFSTRTTRRRDRQHL